MAPLRRTTAVFVAALAAPLACEQIAHAPDFRVDNGICNACPPSSADLRHPPCVSSGAPGVGSIRVYAWRALHAGADPSTYQDLAYDVGLDLDCSARTGDATHTPGEPVWCTALAPFRGAIASPSAWTPLAHGIDNALGQRMIEPLAHFAGIDFDSVLSAGLENGSYTELVVVDGWDGTPNDNQVQTTFIGSPGTVGGQVPVWDGNDYWIPNSNYNDYPHFPSYVSAGVLVADTRGVGEDVSNIALSVNNQTFTFKPQLMVRVGVITPSHLRLTTAGRWSLVDAKQQVPVVATFLANAVSSDPNGAAGAKAFLENNLPGLFDGAADIPLGEQPTDGQPCGALSFGFVSDAEPARIPDHYWY
jgi:hypothetical protein